MAERAVDLPLHKFWWLHDARWYQGVLKRYGQEAANEINAEAMLFVARRVARWYTARHDVDFEKLPMDEFVDRFKEIPRVMWPEDMTNYQHHAVGPDTFETVVTEHFALKMLKAARSFDSYRCPCLEMRAGWFEGMGLTVEDSRSECMTSGSEVCRFRATVRRTDLDPA
ncbi:L-2-amino-thiazoline-4-carboxylic acid hydrolase [Streptomyces sp. RKAG337]|uniref:L-2-amino-thiazoline-4-carboxylic acid hydrolase n=1 Tax=Streptomyces sp. RKAG337 TaxID=2893404 RepID=UPI002033F044|nr:L-2-amino-thiazoline-4-carboxylic acid hydrolase [Streptomyces sp. RKAG337]MCM2429998.1 L-2-amino-thiazoline-4-carboxylic acid hydrolase [Streptomyces sp. RKAG337]